MEKLTQELTSAEGFCKVINENAGEIKATMIREVELEDGTVVKVEGMTPEAIKNVLGATFKTPGEPVQAYVDASKIGPTETTIVNGVAQVYNEATPAEPVNFNVEVGKTYEIKFRETMTLPEDIIDFISNSVIQIANDNETEGNIILGAGYMLGLTGERDGLPYVRTYMNDEIKALAKAMFGGDGATIVDNTTATEGWKEITFGEGDNSEIFFADSVAPETLTITSNDLMDDSGNVDSLDLTEFAWFFKSIKEIA